MKLHRYCICCINTIKSPKTLQQFNQIIIIIGVHTGDNKLVITTESKTVHFDLSKIVGNNLKHEIDFIIKRNERLAVYTIKMKLGNYCPK